MFSEDDGHCTAAATTDEMRAFQYGGGWNGASDARAAVGRTATSGSRGQTNGRQRGVPLKYFSHRMKREEGLVITQRLSNGGRDGGREEGTGEWHQIGWKEIAQIIRRTSERESERAR